MPQPTISRLEAGQTDSVNLSNLEKLAQALGVPAALMIEEKRITQTVKRKTVSKKRLLELLNEALHDEALHGERVSEDCCFDGPVNQLRRPDKTGCNWSDSMQIRCSGGVPRARPHFRLWRGRYRKSAGDTTSPTEIARDDSGPRRTLATQRVDFNILGIGRN